MIKSLVKCGFVALILSLSLISCTSDSSKKNQNDDSVYALMNIPYAEFFKSETTDGNFDALSSATQKVANGSMSYGTYHEATEKIEDAVAKGITCPVKISKALLESLGGTEITDDSASFDITTAARGKSSTLRYSGKQNLFQSKDYSYYILAEAPAYYKEVFEENGKVVFGEIISTPKDMGTLYVTIAAGEAHHDFSPTISFYTSQEELSAEKTSITVAKLSEFNGAEQAKSVTKDENGVEVLADANLSALKTIIATDSDGKEYGLTTLSNFFWGKKQMGFKAPKNEADPEKNYYPQHELVGKTITKLTFVTETDIYTCSKIVKGTVADAKATETTFTPTGDGAFVVDNIQAK